MLPSSVLARPPLPCIVALLVVAVAANDEPRVSVVLPVDIAEMGPGSCPPALLPLLADLESPEAATRIHARAALGHVDWRHLGWLGEEATRGSAERRLALRSVIEALRQRRWSGAPSVPPAGGS